MELHAHLTAHHVLKFTTASPDIEAHGAHHAVQGVQGHLSAQHEKRDAAAHNVEVCDAHHAILGLQRHLKAQHVEGDATAPDVEAHAAADVSSNLQAVLIKGLGVVMHELAEV